MATLYVNADHASSSDAGDYTAAQNAGTPLKTMSRAFTLAAAGDTIRVSYAVNANPADGNGQTDVYAWLPDETFSGTTITAKDASSAQITVTGVSVGGQRPKWFGTSTRFMKNWRFENFQLGYDLGSGFEYNTAVTWLGCGDLQFSGCFFTGGVANVLGFYGHNRLENCEVVSKLSASPGGFMEGVGIRLLAYYDGSTHAGPTDWWEFSGCNFHDIQGEDAVQVLGNIDFGNVLVEDSTFNNLAQAGVAHTDAIQSTGSTELIVRRCTFGVTGLVASMVIGTDGPIETLTMENNLFVGRPGSGYSTQFGGGVRNATIRHNTWVNSVFGGLRIHRQSPANELFGTGSVVISNNLIDRYEIDATNPQTWDETDQFNNVITVGPRTSADFSATPEYGTSADTVWELSNVPRNSAGINQATVTTLTTDRLGRARKGSAPDCGCHESDPTVSVITDPRAPILVAHTPSGTGVAANTGVSVTFYPKPGEQLSPASVTTSTMYVRDAAGLTIPTVLTLGDLDVNGRQSITLNLVQSLSPLEDGNLFPLVSYTVTLTNAIQDTEASAYGGADWTFTVAGTGSPAIGTATPGSFTMSLSADVRFPPGTTLQLFAASGLARPVTPISIGSAVVAANSTVTFTGLDPGRYVAGESSAGPFVAFNVYSA